MLVFEQCLQDCLIGVVLIVAKYGSAHSSKSDGGVGRDVLVVGMLA